LSPTVFRYKNYRFFFFSREEKRIHIHVNCPDGEAKFWIEPKIELYKSVRLNKTQLNEVYNFIKDNEDEIKRAWKKHFGN